MYCSIFQSERIDTSNFTQLRKIWNLIYQTKPTPYIFGRLWSTKMSNGVQVFRQRCNGPSFIFLNASKKENKLFTQACFHVNILVINQFFCCLDCYIKLITHWETPVITCSVILHQEINQALFWPPWSELCEFSKIKNLDTTFYWINDYHFGFSPNIQWTFQPKQNCTSDWENLRKVPWLYTV